METITSADLNFIIDLSSRSYTGNSFLNNASPDEDAKFNVIKNKLRVLSGYFQQKYNEQYGPFEIAVSPYSNPIGRGTTLNNVWAGIYKGTINKQYSAQVSIVINRNIPCLDIGFFFGNAASRTRNINHADMLQQLTVLGNQLADTLETEEDFNSRYDGLFDQGFKAYSEGINLEPQDWIDTIRTHTPTSRIVTQIFPNEFGVIDNSTLDYFISQVMFLMAGLGNPNGPNATRLVKPLTLAQLAKQAERLAEIGLKGEKYIMEYEKNKLRDLGITDTRYPKHVALESMHYGYDIISLDQNEREIYIEVKTTTRSTDDQHSRKFYLTTNEFNVYTQNADQYYLYRVYAVEATTEFEIVNLEMVEKSPNGFVVSY